MIIPNDISVLDFHQHADIEPIEYCCICGIDGKFEDFEIIDNKFYCDACAEHWEDWK